MITAAIRSSAGVVLSFAASPWPGATGAIGATSIEKIKKTNNKLTIGCKLLVKMQFFPLVNCHIAWLIENYKGEKICEHKTNVLCSIMFSGVKLWKKSLGKLSLR